VVACEPALDVQLSELRRLRGIPQAGPHVALSPLRLERGVPRSCPTCGNTALQGVGRGTQRIEESLQALLPTARVLRIDRDATRRRDSAARAFDAVHRGEIDVLVGTQMVTKGTISGTSHSWWC